MSDNGIPGEANATYNMTYPGSPEPSTNPRPDHLTQAELDEDDGLTKQQKKSKRKLEQEAHDLQQKYKPQEASRQKRERREKRLLEQDRAQYRESKHILDTRDWRKDMAISKEADKNYNKQMKFFNIQSEHYEKKKTQYEKDLKKYEKDLAEHNKQIAILEQNIKNEERKDARWYVIEPYDGPRAGEWGKNTAKGGKSWKYKITWDMEKRYREAHAKKWASKIAHNQKMNEKYGSRPTVSVGNVGILSRTSADILSGKSNVPLKQVSSHIYRQVSLVRLRQRYNNTSMTYNEFLRSKASIFGTVAEKSGAEQARRNWSSAISAKSALAKSREAHEFKLREMNKANRNAQMNAVTQQNKLVAMKAGITQGQSNLKQAQGKLQQQKNVQMVRPSQPKQLTTNKPQSANSIYDIPQASFASMMAGRSNLNETIKTSKPQYTQKGDRLKAPKRFSITPDKGEMAKPNQPQSFNAVNQGMFQGPTKPDTFVGVPSLDTFVADNKPEPTFTGTLFGGNPHIEKAYKDFNLFSQQVSKDYDKAKKSGNDKDIVYHSARAVGTTFVGGLLSLPALIQSNYDEHISGNKQQNIKPLFVPKTTSDIYVSRVMDDMKHRIEKPGEFRLMSAPHFTSQHLQQLPLSAQITESVLGVASFVAPIPSNKIGKVAKLTAPSKVTAKVGKGKNVGKTLDVPVSKEFGLFGKTVVTKTYKNPTAVTITNQVSKPSLKTRFKEIGKPSELKTKPTITPKVELQSYKGDFNLGSTKPKKVADRIDFDNNVETGYEVFTGSKPQVKLNEGLAKQSAVKGKMGETELKKLEVVEDIVKLGKEAPSKVYSGLGKQPINRLTQDMNQGLFTAINKLQSPKNWVKARRRVDQVGGSVSQNPQLKPKYQKAEIHDVDLDVRSEKIAERSAKTVFDNVKPFETDSIKINLAKRPTKVETEIEGIADEFFEALSPKDALKGNKEALATGLRFGEKYRTDKLSKMFKRPIKDPDTNVKIRDIQDQTLAKASSVASIQSESTMMFRGTPKPEHIGEVSKMEKTIKSGKLTVGPPPKRMKDVVDLYNIAKSQSEKLTDVGKISTGVKLNKRAEELKGLFPDLDYTANTKGSMSFDSSPSYASLISSKLSSVKPLPLSPTKHFQSQQPHESSGSRKFESPSKTPTSITSSRASITSSRGSVSRPVSSSRVSTTSGRSPAYRTNSLLSRVQSRRGSSRPSSRVNPSTRSLSPFSISKPSAKSPTSTSPISLTSPSLTGPTSPGSFTSPSITSPSVGSTSGLSSSGFSLIGTGQGKSMSRTTRKPMAGKGPKIKSTTDRKPGKKYRTHDFLGNTKTDHIVGLFKRTERMVGDKKTDKQVQLDKKVNPFSGSGHGFGIKGMTSKKSKGFRLSKSKGFKL